MAPSLVKKSVPFKNLDQYHPLPDSERETARNYDNSFLDDQHFYLSNSLEQSFINLEAEKRNHIIVQDLSQKHKEP